MTEFKLVHEILTEPIEDWEAVKRALPEGAEVEYTIKSKEHGEELIEQAKKFGKIYTAILPTIKGTFDGVQESLGNLMSLEVGSEEFESYKTEITTRLENLKQILN